MLQNPHVLLTFDKVHNLVTPNDIWTSKSRPNPWCFLYILTSKCASRDNGVDFFDISTSKSGPSMVCFVHFDYEMCFAPPRRALFRHLSFQKWSEHGVLCTFWLRNVLCATTACTFSTLQLPKVVRTWCVLHILTWTCASRHNSVQFFISHLARWLRTRRFSEPTFRPSGDTNYWKKTQCFATFLPFRAPACSFFWLFLFSDLLSSALLSSTLLFSLTLPISAFHLSILSEVWLLNFLRLYHCWLFICECRYTYLLIHVYIQYIYIYIRMYKWTWQLITTEIGLHRHRHDYLSSWKPWFWPNRTYSAESKGKQCVKNLQQ